MNIAIDFGNSVSRIAHLNEQGIPEVFPDFEDPSVQNTPSAVHIGQRGCLVGESLERLLESEPRLAAARDLQLHLGRTGPLYTDEDGLPYSAPELASLVLRKLVQDAEKASASPLDTVTLAVPARFGTPERQALLDAAALAGLSQVELVDAAAAVARHYGVDPLSRPPRLYLTYDLGGSTFETSLLQAGPDGIRRLATCHLLQGARQLDTQILELARDNFRFAHGFDPWEDDASPLPLRRFATQAKIALSDGGQESIRRTTLLCGKPLHLFLHRRQLEQLLAPLLQETVETCRQCLSQANLSWENLEAILLSGDTCRFPAVRRTLAGASGLAPARIHLRQPGLAVVFGAVQLTPPHRPAPPKDLTLHTRMGAVMDRDLTVQSLVPGTREVRPHTVIRKGSPLPAKREFRCLTGKDGQSTLEFLWALREPDPVGSSLASRNPEEFLGRSIIDGLPGNPKGYPVDVTVSAQIDGAILIETTDPRTGRSVTHTLHHLRRQECAAHELRLERLLSLPVNPT